MSIVVRVDTFTVLGVRFSSVADIEEMRDTLQEGLNNIVEDIPELYQDLQSDLNELNTLVQLESELENEELQLQQLEKEVVDLKEKRVDQISVNWKKTADIIIVIGSTGGTQSPYPTAAAELTPLRIQLEQLEQEIQSKQLQIEQKNNYIAEQIEQLEQRKQDVGNSVINKISEHLSTTYDTSKEEFKF